MSRESHLSRGWTHHRSSPRDSTSPDISKDTRRRTPGTLEYHKERLKAMSQVPNMDRRLRRLADGTTTPTYKDYLPEETHRIPQEYSEWGVQTLQDTVDSECHQRLVEATEAEEVTEYHQPLEEDTHLLEEADSVCHHPLEAATE